MNISEITRRNIFDALRINNINWSGRFDEPAFLSRIFDLKEMPSYDSRFNDAEGDIWKHRINNFDWDDYWVFTDERFNLLKCEDEILLKFLCEIIHPVIRGDKQEADQILQLLNLFLSMDGYEIVERSKISGYPVYAARKKVENLPLGTNLIKTQRVIDTEYISQQITLIEDSISNNPDLAIGTSKELIETCCKTILQEMGKQYDYNWDLTKLVKVTYKELKLTPDDIPDAAKASKTIKRLLSNLATVTQGLAELRNLYGTGHGKSANTKSLPPRHAKLAAGAATALAIFLFETHKARNE
jgi:hypothetical protein